MTGINAIKSRFKIPSIFCSLLVASLLLVMISVPAQAAIPEVHYFGDLPLLGENWWWAESCSVYIDTTYTWAHIDGNVLDLCAAWEVYRDRGNAVVQRIVAGGTEGWAVSYEVKNPSGTTLWSGSFQFYDSISVMYQHLPLSLPSYTMPASGPYGGWTVHYHWHIWSNSGANDFTYDEYGVVTWKVVPTAPLNLQAAAGNGQVSLSWSAPSSNGGASITNYKIYRGTSSGGETLLVTIGNQLSYVDASVTNGVTYYYKVSAVNPVGEGPQSNEVSTKPAGLPSAPQKLQAVAGNAVVSLSWSAPSSNGGASITNYKIYRGTSSGGESYLNTIGNQLSYTDTGVTNGNTYYYQVTAVNSVGEGPQSNEVHASPAAVPSAPQNLQATASVGQVSLTWQTPSSNGGASITDYKIYRGTSSGGESYLGHTNSGSTLIYTDTSVTAGTTYYYKVSAVNAVGEGPQSNEASATVPAKPSAPQNLQAAAGDGQVTLTWSAPASNGGSAVTNYKIYRGTVSGGESYLTTVGKVSSYTNTGLTNGQTYFYEVSAVNAIGESALSGEVSATPSAGPLKPSAPQHVQATPGNSGVALTWQAPSSNGESAITGYKIYRGISSGSESYLASVNGHTLTYTDTGLVDSQTYYYKVSAVNAVGEGPQSDEVNATPTSGNTPSAVQNLQISAGNAQVTLTWSAPANNGSSAITGYKIYRGTTSGSISYIATVTGTTYTDTGLTNGQTYHYKVSAVNGNGEGLLSNEVSATPESGGGVGGGGIDPMVLGGIVLIGIDIVAVAAVLVWSTRKWLLNR